MVKEPELSLLFRSFFKIGLTSFGGHAALVSVLQNELVRNKKVTTDEDILNGLAIASMLPGPLAVNVVTFIGYKLKQWPGAILSMVAVLLPPVILIALIAEVYKRYSNLEVITDFLSGAICVIIGLILSLCVSLFKKQLFHYWQFILFTVVVGLSFLFSSYWVIIIYLICGALAGYLIGGKTKERTVFEGTKSFHLNRSMYYGLTFTVSVFLILYFVLEGIYHQLLFEFSKVSLTLFGGGYVMIPILFEIIVEKFQWLSPEEFANAITFGQITPGPILVTATYVGYVKGHIAGALLATVGIFVPSAMAMVMVGNAFEGVKDHPVAVRIINGVRPVVIALIAYSGWILFESTAEHYLLPGILSLTSFLILYFTKINYLLLILAAGIVGVYFL